WKRGRGEVEPGGRARGAPAGVVDAPALEPEPEPLVQEHVRLGRREPELVGTELEQRSMCPQRCQGQPGLVPRSEHELERRRGMLDEPGDAFACRPAREEMEVVQDERGVAERGQLVDELRENELE